MKKIFSLVVIATTIYSCMDTGKMENTSMCVSVVADSTDPVSVVPQTNSILKLYQFEKYPDQEAIFRFKVIKNVKLIPVTTYHLESTENLHNDEGDPQARSKAVLRFYDEIRSTISDFQRAVSKNNELKNSECFYSIREELDYLVHCLCTHKVLIVYSNLFEKSFVDLYKQDFSSAMLSKLFEKTYALPNNLTGIQVFFVFDPKNDRVTDRRYQVIVSAYKNLLESKGAKVAIQADGNQFEQ